MSLSGGIMTLMKGAPIPTFNSTVRNLLSASLREACAALGVNVEDQAPVVRRSVFMDGDYISGIRVSGSKFHGNVTLSMDKILAKVFADKIFANAPTKADESMLCDLVGEVCNQITGQIQRALGKHGCKMQVSAQQTSKPLPPMDAGSSPEEWLLIPFKMNEGWGVLCFGFVGELGIGSDEVQEDLSDARNITFF